MYLTLATGILVLTSGNTVAPPALTSFICANAMSCLFLFQCLTYTKSILLKRPNYFHKTPVVFGKQT